MDWIKIAPTSSFDKDLGNCVKIKKRQIAIFNLSDKNEWYAVDNRCPHKNMMVLSRGLTGKTMVDTPKVACPLHKRNFCLRTGRHLGDDDIADIATYPIKILDDWVYLGLSQ